MTEYIVEIPEDPAKIVRDGWNVRIDWQYKQREEIVRCRDCRAMRVKYGNTGIECWMNGEPFTVEPNGFCAWGERRESEWVMCKCGEEIELGDREYAVCPSCGRTVRE